MGLDILQDQLQRREQSIDEVKRRFEATYPSENGLRIPEIMALYYARSFRTDTQDFQSFWGYEYGVKDVRAILDMLENQGFIFVGSAADGINNLTISELKAILEKYNLKKSGNKNDLILRIFENIDEDEIDSMITTRFYGLTELGIAELEHNQYVPYFHKTKTEYPQPINVIWMNHELHERPDFQTHWRDLIWGKLSELTNDLLAKRQKGLYYSNLSEYYYEYCKIRKAMAESMIEREEYNTALPLLTEAIYIHLNMVEPKRIRRHHVNCIVERKAQMEFNENWFVKLFVDDFIQIQKGKALSNEALAAAIRESAAFVRNNEEVIPIGLISAWVLADIMKNADQCNFLRDKYINAVIPSKGNHKAK